MGLKDGGSYTSGILNMTGARPGEAFQYEGATMIDQIWYSLTLTTTYEAIEKLILPPPLKVDRSLPPEVRVMYFVNRNCRAFDGQLTPYQPAANLTFGVVAEALYLGADFPGGDEYFDGQLADAKLFDQALTAEQVRALAAP